MTHAQIDTATEEQLRDFIAECRFGMKKMEPGSIRRYSYEKDGCGVLTDEHPVPANLDAAAELPDGWYWQCIERTITGYLAYACLNDNDIQSEAPTERHARFRAQAKAWARVKENV